MTILKKSEVLKIIKLWNKGIKQKDIAVKFSVTSSTICQILQRKIWISVTKDVFIRKIEKKEVGKRKLNKALANKIRQLDFTGKYTQKELGKLFGVTQATIGRILNNIYYRIDLQFKGSAQVKYHGN